MLVVGTQTKIINEMTEEFKILIGDNRTIEEDGEGFDSPEMYQDFLEELTEICSEDFEFEVLEVEEGKIHLSINEEDLKIKYDSEEEWFDIKVIDKINKFIGKNEITEKRLCFVEPFGISDRDQGIKIALLDESTVDLLIEKSYADKSLKKIYHF